MSRGAGRIERAVAAVFETEPKDAFTVEDLIDRIFPGINRTEKKHRVSVIRAAKKVCERTEGWEWTRGETLGSPVVFWNCYNVMSYATMRLKGEMFERYRNHDPRLAHLPHLAASPTRIRTKLSPGGDKHHLIVEGGHWWRHVQMNIAHRDDDQSERATALFAEEAAVERQIRGHAAVLKQVFQAEAV